MAAFAVPLMIGGGVLSGLSSLYGGFVNANNQQAQASAMDYNARLSQQQAQVASNTATAQANQLLNKATREIATQKAFVARGGGGFSGSAFQAIQQSGLNAVSDNYNILNAGEAKSQAYMQQALLDKQNASQLRSNANNSIIGGFLGLATAGLSTAAGIGRYSRYDSYTSQQNMFNPNAITAGGWS